MKPTGTPHPNDRFRHPDHCRAVDRGADCGGLLVFASRIVEASMGLSQCAEFALLPCCPERIDRGLAGRGLWDD